VVTRIIIFSKIYNILYDIATLDLMAKGSKGQSSRKKPNQKLEALMRTQKINELLSKSITESEALQNSGDDRPVYESHVTDLLEEEEAPQQAKRKARSIKRSKKRR
jgi:hypothetical protein